MVPSATVEPNAPGAARPSPPNDPTQVTQFHGLNQRLDPTRLGPEWALQADNVLCDDAWFYVRRPGYAAVRAGVKDAFAAGPNTLWVVDAADRLLALGPTGEKTGQVGLVIEHVPIKGIESLLVERAQHLVENAPCLRFAAAGEPERFASLARLIGLVPQGTDDRAAADALVAKLGEIVAVLKIPTLAEYGIPEADFRVMIPRMAKEALASGSPGNTRRNVTEADMVALYESLY